MSIDVDARLVERYVLELARHGAHGETGVWRTGYSPEWASLCEEEASRFHAARFWGSRAITSRIEPDEANTLRGFEGETIGEAMRAVGLDPARIPEAARDDLDIWIELHIEQGPILEA